MSTFISVIEAAKLKGYSLRHFRRVVDPGQVIQIGRKFFLLRTYVEKMRCR